MTKQTNKKVRMLVVSQYFYPEQFRINDMCAEWVKRGYEVTVVTGIPNYPHGRFFKGYGWFQKSRDVYEGVKVIRLPIISRGSSKLRLGLNYLSFVVSGFIWQLFTDVKPDVVFSFEVSPMTQVLPAVWFAKRRKIPCIAYIQDLWPENFQEMTGIKNGWLIRSIDRMTGYIYYQCALILVTSQSFKEIVEMRNVPAEKVVFWPQYAEDFYKPSPVISPLVPLDDRFTIAFTGNIGTSQGLEVLPKTASILRDKGLSVRFLLVGDGRGMDALKNAIDSEGVSDYFHFIPQQPPKEIPAILAGVDLAFVSFADKPLFRMTIPAKLQSYMACGMPIIAAVRGETKTIIENARCGLCCDPETSYGLTECIIQFNRIGTVIMNSMRENAQNYANANFSKNKLMNEFDFFVCKLIQ